MACSCPCSDETSCTFIMQAATSLSDAALWRNSYSAVVSSSAHGGHGNGGQMSAPVVVAQLSPAAITTGSGRRTALSVVWEAVHACVPRLRSSLAPPARAVAWDGLVPARVLATLLRVAQAPRAPTYRPLSLSHEPAAALALEALERQSQTLRIIEALLREHPCVGRCVAVCTRMLDLRRRCTCALHSFAGTCTCHCCAPQSPQSQPKRAEASTLALGSRGV